MINAKQIRAARAILGWSQQDLADAIGMSKPTIVEAEKDGHQPRLETTGLIQAAFEDKGLDFIVGGVKERVDIVEILDGDDCGIRLLNAAHQALRTTGGDILFYGASERRSTDEIIRKSMEIRQSGIKTRFLIENNDTHILGPLEEYRWMPDKLWLDSDAKTIFGDIVAYAVTWQNKPKIICFKDKRISEIEKKIFDFVWDISAKPTHTSVSEEQRAML
ncbi:MAG: helix-turn-helix transcriptional regulator [Rhodospirillales bacterium]|nr:helix-turn-helix transcriptional regulator [Rhodospirillales bacterium]